MTNNPDYWRQKILCFLHDPPPKALNLGRHEEMAWEMVKAILQGEDEARLKDEAGSLKTADHLASAADRFVFPKGKCSVSWNDKFTFRHPMGEAKYPLGRELKRNDAERAEEFVANALGGIDAEDPRLRFFALWRFLRINTVTQPGAGNMALLPADTRIPDHTIWTHMALTSALHGCRLAEDGRIDIKPAFLVFQLGPVQDFIASARSTRDMWSGSYLLSWLTAHAIKAITDILGPDHILFPAICEQGIFDAIHRESVYEKIRFKGQDGKTDTLWQRLYQDKFYRSNDKRFEYKHQLPLEHLLNPTLPNRFVALVPAEKGQCGYSGEELARQAEQAVLSELHQISEACWEHFQTLIKRCVSEENLLNATQWEDMKKRWDAQVERFPQISWAVFPWEAEYEPAIGKFSKLPINQENSGAEPEKKYTPAEVIKRYHRLATELIPVEDRDERYYSGEGKDRLNLPYGLLWTANYHFADYLMSARRNTREFSQFNTDEHQEGTPKDSLTGKEEIIGSEDLWKALRNSDCKGVFKANELRTGYGAISLIKRLWCRSISGKTGEPKSPSYLRRRLGFENNDHFEGALGFDSVQEIAQRNKRQGRREPANPYVAVLAMDGDQMGKWISGENLPSLKEQLASEAYKYLEDYLKQVGEELPRLLTPSYHMQFSEALANFGNFVAPLIIEHYGGQLIYSGGDDLLVMLPAENAVLCAAALRAAFRGEKDRLPEDEKEYSLRFPDSASGFAHVGRDFPLILPGPAMDVSCGIAVAHYQHPLQSIIAEARKAEKRAKHGYDRSAMAMTILKRGGEILEWGCKWDDGAIKLYRRYCDYLKRLDEAEKAAREKQTEAARNVVVSGRFPYALATYLAPYRLAGGACEPEFDPQQVIRAELRHVIEQQGNIKHQAAELQAFEEECTAYLKTLCTQNRPHDFAGLFLAATFIHRNRED